MLHGGFRSDWNLSARDTLTVQGDLLQTSEGQTINVTFSKALPREGTFNDKVTVGSGNLLGRWNRTLANGSDISLQTYFDRYQRVITEFTKLSTPSISILRTTLRLAPGTISYGAPATATHVTTILPDTGRRMSRSPGTITW